MWISYMYTYIPSLLSLPPSHPYSIPLGHHREPSWSPWAIEKLPTSYLFYTWAVHIWQFCSLNSSYLLLLLTFKWLKFRVLFNGPSSIHNVELKHKDKDLIPPLENDAWASRKHYHSGLGKGRGNEFTCCGGKEGPITNNALQSWAPPKGSEMLFTAERGNLSWHVIFWAVY